MVFSGFLSVSVVLCCSHWFRSFSVVLSVFVGSQWFSVFLVGSQSFSVLFVCYDQFSVFLWVLNCFQ